MLEKQKFVENLNDALELALDAMECHTKDRPHLHIANVEAIDFNVFDTLSEWADENNVNLAVVDIAALTPNDAAALPSILSKPTVLLLENFGNYLHDVDNDALREPYRSLIKDCCYGYNCIFANNFLFAVVTTTKDKPILDMSEKSCFRYYN